MEKDDVQLIRKVLLGDNEAFSALVRKYQKGVHALAWRKVKDFHFAEVFSDLRMLAQNGTHLTKD